METIDLPLLLTSLTALAAVVCPAISTCVTVRSNERSRRTELHAPKVYESVSRMISAFHLLHRQGDHVSYSGWDQETRLRHSRECFSSFSVACFEVMALLSCENIRSQLTGLLSSLTAAGYQASADHEAVFNQVVADIAKELSCASSKYKLSPNRKRKSRHAKDRRG